MGACRCDVLCVFVCSRSRPGSRTLDLVTATPVSSASSATPGSPATPTKPRIALWDNARFLLIVLVVMAHAVSTIRTDSECGFAVYAYIYLFHMPAMIALSGVFSKPVSTPKAVKSTLQLVVVWLIWEGVWALIHLFVEDRAIPDNWLISPAWTLWFLLTLATMRIVLPYIALMRYPLAFSIVLALVAGFTPAIGTEFSASRTLCFLPFFVAGWLAKDRGWLEGKWFHWPTPALKAWAWAMLALIAAVFVVVPGFRKEWRLDKWLTWRDDYAWLFDHASIGNWAPTEWWATALGGVGVRSGLLLIAAIMTLALLIVVSREHSVITVWGARTLYVYLLHAPIIWTLRQTGAVEWMGGFGVPGVLLALAVGAVIAVVLSMTWVTRVFRPVIEPRLEWLYSREALPIASSYQFRRAPWLQPRPSQQPEAQINAAVDPVVDPESDPKPGSGVDPESVGEQEPA